jgi:CRISPR/Cas system-associated exonuclease Cas4 (RecB family)
MQLSHSFSSIKLFENCPLRYYHQRIAKTVKDQGGEASLHGERIHKFLEERLKGVLAELPPEARNLEPVVDSIVRMIGNGSLDVEREMTLNSDLQPTGWWAPDAWIRSKLDVNIIKGSSAIVMDWKTGKRRPDFTQLELFALQVFAHHPEVTSVTSTFVWTQGMAMDKEVYHRDDAHKMWEKLLSRIQRIEQAAESENWPAKPSGLCQYCPCKSFCDYAK